MEAKWSSLVSYGMSLEALQDFLPLEVTLDVKTVRYDTLKVAKRLEARAGRCWGLCHRRHFLTLNVHVWIPAFEDDAQFSVERPPPD